MLTEVNAHGKRDTLSVSAESLTAASASVTSAKSADSGRPYIGDKIGRAHV